MNNTTNIDLIDAEVEEVLHSVDSKNILPYIFDAIALILVILALISNVLLVYTISVNKIIRTKPYLILAAWSCGNAYLLIRILLEMLLRIQASFSNGNFLIIQFDIVVLSDQIIFMFVLILDKLSASESVKIKYLFSAIFCINLTQFTTVLYLDLFTWPVINVFSLLISFGLTLLVLLYKECMRFCCKKPTTEPTALFRMNVVRIVVYNALLVFFILYLSRFIALRYMELVSMSFILTSFYILVCMIKCDPHFKLCFAGLCKRDVMKYNVVASLGVNGEDSVHLNI